MYLDQKKITASGLLLLVAIPILFSASLLVKQKILHYQRDQKFNKEVLQTVVVSADAIYWVKTGKEILLDGKLFDVKSFTTTGKKISLLGFFDHKEDTLVQEIVKREKQKKQTDSPVNSLKFLFFPVYITQADINYDSSWKLLSKHFYHYKDMIPSCPGYPVIHPPQLAA